MKTLPKHTVQLNFSDIDQDLMFLGLCGLIDPPRPEAIEAVATCQRAGIRVKMITGDHRVTAMAIAEQVGLINTAKALTGQDITAMDDAELSALVDETDIYARVTPEHKLRLVTLLQARGQVVSMTGDGVNDAPALRRADVGVAMGLSGTEVAKESAEMVLTDDNFATIVNAIKEGRTVYDNLRKAILFILPTNGGEALVMLGAIMLGFEHFPLTPVQILWVNMITAATLALALAFEPAERGIMRRPPRDPREPVLTRLFLWRILFVSVILVIGTFGLFVWQLESGAGIEYARTVAVNTLVAYEIFYLFNSRFILEPVLNRDGLLGNRYVLLAVGLLVLFQLGFTYIPTMQSLFGTAALDLQTWGAIILVASSVLWLVELEKLAVKRSLQRKS
jgi:magnesium-transporting ATPase (P-type)